MDSRLFLLSAAVFVSISPASAIAGADPEASYTLQVGAFPSSDLADKFVSKLIQLGEHPTRATVELEGRGYWTRVFVGRFPTGNAARRYGDSLIERGIVNQFLVRRPEPEQVIERPRRVTPASSSELPATERAAVFYVNVRPRTVTPLNSDLRESPRRSGSVTGTGGNLTAVKRDQLVTVRSLQPSASPTLASFIPARLQLAPGVDTKRIPRPEPVALAFKLIVGEPRSRSWPSADRGGLWVTGDTNEGLERLRWIVGDENGELVKLERDGRVQLDRKLLAREARLGRSRVEDPLQVADYITSNEGLLLLVQLAEGRYRYRIHIGQEIPTRGKPVEITGSINLDKNFDSRINTYRKNGKKLDSEQPPEGFDSLVGLNPAARWFNLSANYWVQAGQILFHELAEAYAKLEVGLDYLEHGSEPGAHAMALDRERRLQSQRPASHIVMTAGSNRVLRTQEEIRLFYAESASQR